MCVSGPKVSTNKDSKKKKNLISLSPCCRTNTRRATTKPEAAAQDRSHSVTPPSELTNGATRHGGEDPHGGQRPFLSNEGVRLSAAQLAVLAPLRRLVTLIPGTGKVAHSIWDKGCFDLGRRENTQLIYSFGK